MKTIKQFREEYDSEILAITAPDELMLEGRENSVIKAADKAVPSPSVMPTMLMFRRVAYRQYPGKQVVALYYSKLVNKYLSIPFGPDGNLNLSEAVVLDEGAIRDIATNAAAGHIVGTVGGLPGAIVGTAVGAGVGAYKAYKKSKEKKDMKEDWSDSKYKNPEGGLTKAGVMAYRRENPGSKLQTAVTTKPSKLKKGSKAANRRKSFCARMGGMKKRLTSAKTARDPDSRINKALRKWNCEESFRAKLAEKRQERLDEIAPLIAGVGRLALGAAAGDALLSVGKAGAKMLMKGVSKLKGGAKSVSPKTTAPVKTPKTAKSDALSSISRLVDTGSSASSGQSDSDSAYQTHKGELLRNKSETKTTSSWKSAKSGDDTFQSKYKRSLGINENKISDIQNMINEGIDNMDLSINGRTVTLNNSMAKKIVRVYESVNTKNKKIVESMLNEDLDSFKKLLNFSIKA